MAPYGLVDGERVSGVMAGTLKAGKNGRLSVLLFWEYSLADARFFANSCLALNFGWVEMKVDSY